MPSKSRRKRGKQSFHSKKRKGKLTTILRAAEKATASESVTPAAPSMITAPLVNKPVSSTTPTAAKYPYVTSELKRIGIIALIMIAVLVILSRVLY